jgi:SAM-dependent methyltransferase
MIKKSLIYLQNFFDFDKILLNKLSKKDIIEYYRLNHIAYNIIHDKRFIHMWFTENNKKFQKTDLKNPLKYIDKYINKETKNILELACWRWSNSNELFKTHKNIHFTWIDLSKKQISYCNNKKTDTFVCDYHNLSTFKNNSLNLVFIIESLCYSDKKEKVFKEVFKTLKKGWKFIVIDWYSNIPNDKISNENKKALILTAKWMSLNKEEYYKDVVSYWQKSGFTLIEEYNKSMSVLPSMKRIKKRISRLSRFWKISKFIFKLMWNKIGNNFIAWYLMPELIEAWVATYMVSVFEKK